MRTTTRTTTRPTTRPSEFKGGTRTATERRAFAFAELKATDDNAGLFEGYLAVFKNQDGNGDVIDRGAFTKTLREAHETKARTASPYLFPLLWQHNDKEPIGGFIEAHEDDHGLYVRGQYDIDIEQGRRAYSGAKKGYLRGLSIGYDTVKSMFVKDARHLLEIRLWEGSPVTFPANDQAQITDVKGLSGKTDWPIADRDTAWDSGAAHGRLLEWAGGKDDLDTAKFSSVHFWSPDGDAKQNVSEYKFPFCDVIGGTVKAIPKAVFAATGAHGIQAAKGVDTAAIKTKIAAYYSRMAKQFDDDTIQPPWSAKAMNHLAVEELKQLAGLQALTCCATSLDNVSDGAEGLVETLAGACGMSVEGPSTGKPDPTVAALLAGVDGLEAAVKAVVAAWQEFDIQTDALLDVLGLPDDDSGYGYGGSDYAMPMYMSQLRSAFELKVGRQLSAGNRDRLAKVADGLMGHADELKSILKENDKNPLSDEGQTGADYGDVISSGQHNRPGKGQEGARDRSRASSTTPPSTATEPPANDADTQALETLLIGQQLDLLNVRR